MNRPTFEPDPLAAVDCHASDDRWTLVFVRDLPHGSVGTATLAMIDGAPSEALPASVRTAEPPTRLEYTWGNDLLHWELVAVDAGTRLTLKLAIAGTESPPDVE